jgi:hypothetical protein
MRFLCIALLMLGSMGFLGAQSTCSDYQTFRPESSFEITNYDKKDRVTSVTIHQVDEFKSEGEGFVASIRSTVNDEDGEALYEGAYEVVCQGGVLTLDAASMINPGVLQSYYEMDMEMTSEGLEVPGDLSDGQALPEANTKISVSTSGLTIMSMQFSYVNREVERQETIETPAGTFSCWVISQTLKMDAGLVKREYQTREWFAPGVGMVRSETYDSRDRLESYSQLTKLGE